MVILIVFFTGIVARHGIVVQEGGRVIVSGSVQEASGCGTWGDYGGAGLMVGLNDLDGCFSPFMI